jgi:Leucine-rich repeat (LRR) protein
MLSDQEFNALHDLYISTNGDSWLWYNVSSTIPWNFSVPNVNPCVDKWQGLDCSCTDINCTISSIDLNRHNMSGQLPLAIGSFPSLRSLSFHVNNISGTLPTTIGNLTKLEILDLSTNMIFGEIPKQIGSLQDLQTLDLSKNAFTKLPEEFFTLTKLRELHLAANSIDGPISPAFGHFHNLVTLQLSANYFSRNLPDIFDSFPSLETFNIEKNNIRGALPPSFYKMYNLSSLIASYTGITSTLSSAFGNLTNLQTLHLSKSFFHGSLPEAFGKLTKLVDCEIDNNLFTGSVPSSLAALPDIHLLYIQANSFTGDVSFLTRSTKVNSLDLTSNFFNGTFLVQTDQLLHLRYFQISGNSFNGPMPWNQNWTELSNYEIHDNSFSGVLPHENTTASEMGDYQDCAHLGYMFTDQNYLTGTIPEYFYLSCPWAYYFIFSDNYLTGTISQSISSLTSLNQWNVSLNYLTGTIPAEIGSLVNVSILDFSNNQFTGKVPPSLQELNILQEFFIQNNELSGSLSAFLGGETSDLTASWLNLLNIDLSGNKFTGTLPSNFFASASDLETFTATSNCLRGSIPEVICTAHFLTSLSLDGLITADNCRNSLFPAVSSLFNGFTVTHFMQGTIPPCLFEMPSLQLLHLSGNGITGSIPSNVSIPANLTDLSLSHNLLTGTIPMNIQNKYWDNLDLSYNKLTGTLSSQFLGVFDPSGNHELYLEVNRLSGIIPSSFQNITNLAVLNGNIFSCGWKGEDLPKHDSDYSDYSCGSNSVDYILLGWIGTLLVFPVIFLILFKYVTSTGMKNVSESIGSFDDLRFTWGNLVGIRSDIEGKSSVHENVPRGFTGFQFFAIVYQQINSWKRELRRESLHNNLNLVRLSHFLGELRRSTFLVTAYCVCILLPLYCIIKKFEASFSVEYAWYVGGILLSGEIAAVVLFLALFAFLLLIYYLLGERLVKTINCKAPKSDVSELTSDFVKAEVDGDETNSTVKKSTADSLILALNYNFIFICDLIVMGIVDFSYVYIVVNYSNTVVTLAAFCLAAFRLSTNNLLLWKAIPVSISVITYLMPAWKELYFYQQKYPGNVKNVSTFYTYRDISFLGNLVLFNNIILPVLATIFILPDCFYNALFAAPDVSSYYSYSQCDRTILAFDFAWMCNVQTQYLSYSPPYIYSYQCSSKVVINYASVYILMFIMAGVTPLLKLGLKLYYDTVVIKNIHKTETPTQQQLKVKFYIEKIIPNYYKQIRETRERDTTPDAQKEKPRSFALFSKLRLTLKINSYLTILATFGALFPPLAIVGCLTIFIVTYFEELSVGWLLAETRAKKYFWYEEQLNHEAENVEESSNFTLWSTLTVSSFLYGYIVFDTMGDSSGWEAALPMTLLLLCFPLLWYVFTTCVYNGQDFKFFAVWLEAKNRKSYNESSQNALSNVFWKHRKTAAERSSQIELNDRPSKEKDNAIITTTNPIYH